MSILDLIAERLPELTFKRYKNGKIRKVILKKAEATEMFFDGRLYRVVIEEVDD